MAHTKTIQHLRSWLKKEPTQFIHGMLHHHVNAIYEDMMKSKRVTDWQKGFLESCGHWKG